MDSDRLEHSSVPIKLGVVAERPFRHLDTTGQGVMVVVVLGLLKGWEFLSAISTPAEKEVEGQSRKRAEDWISIPHTTHVFNLPVLVCLALLHCRDHTWRGLVRFRALILQIDEHEVGKLELSCALTPSNGSMACTSSVRV